MRSYPTPSANIPNLPDITPDMSQGMPGAAAVAQLLALAGGGNYQLGDQQRLAFGQAMARQEQAREQQRMQMEQEQYVKGQEEQDFNRALQLVQAGVKPQDAFAAAPRTPGNRFPVLDAIYKQGQDAKKAKEAKAEQTRNVGFLQQGGIDYFLSLPSDQRAAIIAQVAGPEYGMGADDLTRIVAGREASLARQKADKAAERAAQRAPQDPYEAGYDREQGKRDAAADAARENPSYRGARRRGASDQLARRYAEGKPGVFADPVLFDVPRQGGVEAQNKLAGTVQALELMTDLRALTEVVAKYGKGGVGAETIADVGRRTGNPQAFESAFSAARSAVISLQAKARSGLQLNETELRFLSEALPLLSETVLQDGKLAKGVEARLRMTERELESGYWAGVEPRIARSQRDELKKMRHKQKARRRGYWENFLTEGRGTKSEATLEGLGLFE